MENREGEREEEVEERRKMEREREGKKKRPAPSILFWPVGYSLIRWLMMQCGSDPSSVHAACDA